MRLDVAGPDIVAAQADILDGQRRKLTAQRDEKLANFAIVAAHRQTHHITVDQLFLAGKQSIFAATELQLQFSGGEYRLFAGKEKLVDRYVVSLPVRGDYREIRQFLVALRSEFPTLAIEDVSLRRDNIGASDIEAQLRLILFTRRAASL